MNRTYLKEKIGNPELFTGRRQELAFFLTWIQGIKKEISHSTAILSRRKTGKTALLQRLYNVTFERNDGVIPFYYEVKEGKRWALEFCLDFFMAFITQYIAFKTRNPAYINPPKRNLSSIKTTASDEGLHYIVDVIEGIENFAAHGQIDLLWQAVREAPMAMATRRNEYIVQIIDEFQYLNSEICRDKTGTHVIEDFAAGYMSTAEYRNAPLLISGSWIGWLRYLLLTMLPSRFRQHDLENMPEDETLEMVYKYSQMYDVPIEEDVAYAMTQVCEGNPFYVSALFHSPCRSKNFTSQEGLVATLEYETLNMRGHIRLVWMEYLSKIFRTVNENNAKNIVLYLSKNRDRQVGRDELLNTLQLDMTDFELEQKLHALVKSDIIEQGSTNFDYQGVPDNIFDKVFRGMYQKDIQTFDPQEITSAYRTLYQCAKADYKQLLGRYNQTKGLFAEFAIINQLRLHAFRNQARFQAITRNLPKDFEFVEYDHVWSYKTARADKGDIQIDLFARAEHQDAYTLIGEVKNRDTRAFSVTEAVDFVKKADTLKRWEEVERAVLFVFSRHGFTSDAIDYFEQHQIAYSDDEGWLG